MLPRSNHPAVLLPTVTGPLLGLSLLSHGNWLASLRPAAVTRFAMLEARHSGTACRADVRGDAAGAGAAAAAAAASVPILSAGSEPAPAAPAALCAAADAAAQLLEAASASERSRLSRASSSAVVPGTSARSSPMELAARPAAPAPGTSRGGVVPCCCLRRTASARAAIRQVDSTRCACCRPANSRAEHHWRCFRRWLCRCACQAAHTRRSASLRAAAAAVATCRQARQAVATR